MTLNGALKYIEQNKDMANGMRDTSKTPLSELEIDVVKSEIQRISADLSVFVFNDEEHISVSTCYNFVEDKIYVTRNVFPDKKIWFYSSKRFNECWSSVSSRVFRT